MAKFDCINIKISFLLSCWALVPSNLYIYIIKKVGSNATDYKL